MTVDSWVGIQTQARQLRGECAYFSDILRALSNNYTAKIAVAILIKVFENPRFFYVNNRCCSGERGGGEEETIC